MFNDKRRVIEKEKKNDKLKSALFTDKIKYYTEIKWTDKADETLGVELKPRRVHDEQRCNEIMEVMQNCLSNNKSIPIEWVEEYNELIIRLK